MRLGASVEGDATLRLFLALRLPDDTLDELERWAAVELTSGRRIWREDLHITLAFLGRQRAAELPGIVVALRAAVAESSPFPLQPLRYRETRSVGMVVMDDPTGAAVRLADNLHARLEALGVYRRERRPWLPHLTVLRFRERPRLQPALPGIRTFVPSDAAAYVSYLHPSGARYEVIESMSLGG